MATKKAKKKNQYQRKAKQKNILGQMHKPLDTKGNIKNSALETGRLVLIGVLGGGVLSAVIGKPSFLIGMAATGAGGYLNNNTLSVLGLGMMASNSFVSKGINGVEGLDGLDGVKERVMAFKEELMDKTYLNKLRRIATGGTAPDTKTVGELQYFDYANDVSGHSAALANIESQLMESGMQFHEANNMGFVSTGEEIGLVDENLY